MEYKIFYYMRHKSNTPLWFRLFFAVILFIISLFPIILPLFPGSLFVWIFLLVVWLVRIIPTDKLKYVIKIRKSIVHLFKNLGNKKMLMHKVYDIKTHVKKIFRKKRNVL